MLMRLFCLLKTPTTQSLYLDQEITNKFYPSTLPLATLNLWWGRKKRQDQGSNKNQYYQCYQDVSCFFWVPSLCSYFCGDISIVEGVQRGEEAMQLSCYRNFVNFNHFVYRYNRFKWIWISHRWWFFIVFLNFIYFCFKLIWSWYIIEHFSLFKMSSWLKSFK